MSSDAGGCVAVRVHADPVDVMPGVMAKLGEKRSLDAAIALTEWVQGIDIGEELRESDDELLTVQAPQSIRCREPAEDIGGVRIQMLRQAEQRPLREGYRPQFPGPRVEIAKDVTVERPQMIKVVGAGQSLPFQVDQPGRR